MAKKPLGRADLIEVIYDDKHWCLLTLLRSQALELMEALAQANLPSIVHGSIARGDVSKKSDVDVFLPEQHSSFSIENALEAAGFPSNKRILIQATPAYAFKGYLEIGENRRISFPLLKMRRTEKEFYTYGGELGLQMLRNSARVAGADKRLMLIEPTTTGHVKSEIVGREEDVARFLGISADTVYDRVRALLRRDKIGRTGVFIERVLSKGETFEMVLQSLARENPAVRRRLRT
ncbi:MAG TPA: nucleotidyltransferase domain-containing protein [Candidatus Bathyarchaeia archaeon]|nr:nucleotidyltransferase domain-containing protein [Candidatus Bathyarchaeia archaeon]